MGRGLVLLVACGTSLPGAGSTGSTGSTSVAPQTTTGSSSSSSDGVTSEPPGTASAPGSSSSSAAPPGGPRVVFLNFDGADLESGTDDAPSRTTEFAPVTASEFPPFGVGPKRDAIVELVQGHFAGLDFEIVDVEPASGDYAMVMFGPSPHLGINLRGDAVTDCGDANPRNIAFVIGRESDTRTAENHATWASKLIARNVGVERTDDPSDLAYQSTANEDATFLDECVALSPTQRALCPDQHAAHCGAGEQASGLELAGLE